MAESTLTSKGQMTVPKEVRERLKLRQGDRFEFIVDGERIVIVPKRVRLDDLCGIVSPHGRRATLAEMDAAVRRSAAKRVRGGSR